MGPHVEQKCTGRYVGKISDIHTNGNKKNPSDSLHTILLSLQSPAAYKTAAMVTGGTKQSSIQQCGLRNWIPVHGRFLGLWGKYVKKDQQRR